MRLKQTLTFLTALCGLASADPGAELRESLASEDPEVRRSAAAAIVERWEVLTPEEKEQLRSLESDADPEVAAAARSLRREIEARTRFGPWIWERGVNLATGLESGRTTADAELLWAAEMWNDGRASDREAREFYLELVRALGEPPPFSGEIIREASVRPFAPLFDAWAGSATLPRGERVRALSALASAGDLAFSERFWRMLESENEDLRYAAVDGLRQMALRDDGRRFLPLLADPVVRIRRATLETLAEIAGPALAPAVRPLLDDPEGEVVFAAIDVLGRWGDRESVPRFGKFILDERLRDAALRALAATGGRVPEEVRMDAVRSAGSMDPAMFRAIFGDRMTRADVGALIELERSGGASWNVYRLMTDWLDPELAASLVEDGPVAVRREVVLALTRLPRPRAVSVLRRLLAEDDDAKVRSMAAVGLDELGERSAAPEIAVLLDSINTDARQIGHIALSGLGSVDQIDRIALGLTRDEGLRRISRLTLSWLDARQFRDAFRESIATETPRNRARTTELSIRWAGPESVGWLKEQLAFKDAAIRFQACERLLRLGEFEELEPWLLHHVIGDTLPSNDVLVAVLECGGARGADMVMQVRALVDPGDMVVRFFAPWPRAWSQASPEAFAALDSNRRRDTLRRLRNLSTHPILRVELSAQVALARLGELSDAALLDLLESCERGDLSDGFQVGRRSYLGEVLSALNSAKEPAAWALLHRSFVPASQIVTEQDFVAIARGCGIEVMPEGLRLRHRTAPGYETTLAAILEHQMKDGIVPILEGGRLKFLDVPAACASWKRRLR